ncbi:MAG TPA: hypothetical protein VKZ18_28825 [Polyangia bacterium]|nr:hypothetical protein [Polyangia bacterium]
MIEKEIAAAAVSGLAPVIEAAADRIVERVLAEIARRFPEPQGWFTRAALAAQLQISMDTLDRRIASGDSTIEVQKIGRAVRCRLRPPVTREEIGQMAAEAMR